MNIIFYNLNAYAGILQSIFEQQARKDDTKVEFYTLKTLKCLLQYKHPLNKCILFYQFTDEIAYQKLINFMYRRKSELSYVAICQNDREGILAMNNGSFYALLIPLQMDCVITCYHHIKRANTVIKEIPKQ